MPKTPESSPKRPPWVIGTYRLGSPPLPAVPAPLPPVPKFSLGPAATASSKIASKPPTDATNQK